MGQNRILEGNPNYKCYTQTLTAGQVVIYDIDSVFGAYGVNVMIFKNGSQAVNIRLNSLSNDLIPIAANETLILNQKELIIHSIIVANNNSGASNAAIEIIVTGKIF